jgi:hypothetical protein
MLQSDMNHDLEWVREEEESGCDAFGDPHLGDNQYQASKDC